MSEYPSPTLQDFDRLINRNDTGSMKWEKYAGRDVLPFWVADMDFVMAEPIRQALQARMQHPIIGYSSVSDSLREAIVAHMQQEYGYAIKAEWLVFLPGVVPGLNAAVRAFVKPGHAALVNPPIYHHFFDVHDPEVHRLDQVPLQRDNSGRWRLDVDATVAAITEETDALLLCSPHNPVGTVHKREELQALLNKAAEQGCVVVSDEIHCDLILDPEVRHVPTALVDRQHAANIVTLMSASKTFNLAGLNCSWAVIEDENLRERFSAIASTQMSAPHPLALIATEAALREGQSWRAVLLDYLRGNRDLVMQELASLPELEVQPMQATYLAWIDCRGLGVDSAADFFEAQGVGLSAGEQFGQSGYVRLNFACPRGMLQRGLDRIRLAVERWRDARGAV